MKQIIEQKVKEFSELIQSALTKQQFLDAFKSVLDYLKKIEASLNSKVDTKIDELEKLNKLYQESVKRIEEKNDSSFSNFKKWVLEGVGKFFINSKINDKIREIDERLAEINAYEPPSAEVIALEASKLAREGLLPLIPIIDKVEEKLPRMGGLIATALESLDEEDKLKVEAIKGLKGLLEEIRQIKGRSFGGGGFSKIAMDTHIIPWTEATGTPNDVLTDFVIGHSPNPESSLEVMVDNSMLFLTTDFTYATATRTISFLIAPPTGSKIRYKCLV